ncbi:MAG TPA: hypothetical protein PKM41_13010 [Deltaproteobacteria bacterium]|nr:hypothetical protein [Deltaproteobacteria bacterium]HOI07952.1 hypothetical protein [Deltaproteobacteria bacterium]
MDLSSYSAVKPGTPVHLLFIHETAGAQLMAGKGPDMGEPGILKTHPNGGGLRALLSGNNYIVHEAAEGSKLGGAGDVGHWGRIFLHQMETILRTKRQDMPHSDGTRNRVVMFQSGPASSWIDGDGTEPGKPDGKEKTLANYKAVYRSLLACFRLEPETLFVAVTAPPLVKPQPAQGIISRILGRSGQNPIDEAGKRIRAFNNWLKGAQSGWLNGYPLKNVVVFDCFDVLTCYGASNWLRYPSGPLRGNLPSAEGNAAVARDFVPFINRAWNRMTQIPMSARGAA